MHSPDGVKWGRWEGRKARTPARIAAKPGVVHRRGVTNKGCDAYEARSKTQSQPEEATDEELSVCDRLVRIGWAFLSLGMTMGALWAKEAWGDYWTWDPKETWAFATWLSYLLYLHLRPSNKNQNLLFAWLIFSFILLQMCWWGINFLPSAQGVSIHTYS